MEYFEFEYLTSTLTPQERSRIFNSMRRGSQRELIESTNHFRWWMEHGERRTIKKHR